VRHADLLYRALLCMSVCFEFYVLSGRGLCDGLFPRTEETYGCLSVVSDVCCQVEVCATV